MEIMDTLLPEANVECSWTKGVSDRICMERIHFTDEKLEEAAKRTTTGKEPGRDGIL